jgi:hypothetical protein
MPKRKSLTRSRKAVSRQRKARSLKKTTRKSISSKKSHRKYRSANTVNRYLVPSGGQEVLLKKRLEDIKKDAFNKFDITNLIKIISPFLKKSDKERGSTISVAKSHLKKLQRKSMSELEKIFSDNLDIIEKCKEDIQKMSREAGRNPAGYFTSFQAYQLEMSSLYKHTILDWVSENWKTNHDPNLKKDLLVLLTLYKDAIQARGDLDWAKQVQQCIDDTLYADDIPELIKRLEKVKEESVDKFDIINLIKEIQRFLEEPGNRKSKISLAKIRSEKMSKKSELEFDKFYSEYPDHDKWRQMMEDMGDEEEERGEKRSYPEGYFIDGDNQAFLYNKLVLEWVHENWSDNDLKKDLLDLLYSYERAMQARSGLNFIKLVREFIENINKTHEISPFDNNFHRS